MSCTQCMGVKKLFNDKMARRDLKRYLKKGPNKSTKILLELIRSQNLKDYSLLDIGGGIGVIQHELYSSGLKTSTDVDASPDYLATAKEESKKRNNEQSSQFIEGDFTSDDVKLKSFDIVTLDRVICCYDEMEKLVGKSSSLADKIYAVVYPRNLLFLKIGSKITSLIMYFFRNPYRMFIHSPEKVDEIIRNNGFFLKNHKNTLLWRIDLYVK